MPKTKDPLVAYREEHNLTQKQLAKRLKVSRQLIAKLETQGTYTAEMAVHIERRLGINRSAMRPDLWEPMAA